MRHQGKLSNWKDDRGFGFINPDGGGDDVFVHISSFSNRRLRPSGDEPVTYELQTDKHGRLQAKNVAFLSDKKPIRKSSVPGSASLFFATVFLALITAAFFAGKLPLEILGLYLVASVITFIIYAIDKSAAQYNRWRTAESTLHLLSLVGGWPGAFIAQKLLRHKSSKRSFQIVFWATIIFNCSGLVWIMTPSGSEMLRSVVNGL